MLAAATAGLAGAGLLAWEYATRDEDAAGRIEYLRVLAQNHSHRMLAAWGLAAKPPEPPRERCSWPAHCRSELLKGMSFRGTEVTVDLVHGRRMVIAPRLDESASRVLGWTCKSDLPGRLRPALCSAP